MVSGPHRSSASGALRSLYICYLSLEDPLVQTQVVAYLEGLTQRGHTVHLLTFEPRHDKERRRCLAAELERRGITWHSLRYHKRPSLPATIYDALVGALVAVRLVRRHHLDAVHARSHVPAATGLIVRGLTGKGLIFDIRGLLGDEYVDAGRWRRGSLAHRITERIQRTAIERADGIVVLTERVRRYLFSADDGKRVEVIPCCVDLDRLEEHKGEPEELRTKLGLEGRSVMAYVGKLTEPYMDREMVDFFAAARRLDPSLAFLVLTQAPPESIVAELSRAGIPKNDYRIARAEPGELGDHLALAEFAICFCRPSFARIASSPTKIGEYLAAGLPVVSGPGIGDVDEILVGRSVGVLAESFSDGGYERCVEEVRQLVSDPASRVRCRDAARELFSLEDVGIPRYHRLYGELAGIDAAG
jgi:glycosyltransferase involved in cell wall biosynthesis